MTNEGGQHPAPPTNQAWEFMRRWNLQEKDLAKWRALGGEESGEAWEVAVGDYSRPIYRNDFGIPTAYGMEFKGRSREQSGELLGVEKTLGAAIDCLIENSQKRPIVIMDYGGGLGVSWCRLAKHYESYIKSGEMVFVVTNLEKNFDPTTVLQKRIFDGDPSSQIVQYVLEHKLITFVEGELAGASTPEVKALRNTKIDIPGQTIPLYSNCDLIHTRMSLIHSETPEFHHPRLMELLSPEGAFIDSTFTSEGKAPAAHELSTDKNLTQKQKARIFEAYQYCLKFFELSPVTKVEAGEHKDADLWVTVLKKAHSPVKISA